MRKSILTIVLLATIQLAVFSQQKSQVVDSKATIEAIQKFADEKSDITGTFANAGGWNIFVDDAKTEVTGKEVKKFADADMQTLLRKGYAFAQKNKSKNACYKYRIVAEKDGSQNMFLYDCGL